MMLCKHTIVDNLRIISLIHPGDTLSSTSMTILDHNSWSTTIWRLIRGESRDTTVTYIRHIFMDALHILMMDPYIDQSLITNIKLGLIGLRSLKVTYKLDPDFGKEIDTIISYIEFELTTIINKKIGWCQKES